MDISPQPITVLLTPTQDLWIDLDGELIECTLVGWQKAETGPVEGAINGITLRRKPEA